MNKRIQTNRKTRDQTSTRLATPKEYEISPFSITSKGFNALKSHHTINGFYSEKTGFYYQKTGFYYEKTGFYSEQGIDVKNWLLF